MKELCKNIPVHRVKHFETNGDEEVSVEAVQRYLNSQLLPKRFKRNTARLAHQPTSEHSRHKLGRTLSLCNCQIALAPSHTHSADG